jgi:hypothetical protein
MANVEIAADENKPALRVIEWPGDGAKRYPMGGFWIVLEAAGTEDWRPLSGPYSTREEAEETMVRLGVIGMVRKGMDQITSWIERSSNDLDKTVRDSLREASHNLWRFSEAMRIMPRKG